MQKITEEFYFDDGSRIYHIDPNPEDSHVKVGRFYSFEFCRKSAVFDGVAVDQFWMALNSLYGRKGANPRNYDLLVELYRGQCNKSATILHDEVVDSYILAKLLPYVRRNGSRHVFDDAILTSPQRFGERKQDLVLRLESQLAASRHDELDLESFHRKTNVLLGKPDMPEAADAYYREMADELLSEGRQAFRNLGPVDGIQVAILKLQSWMKTFARRSGHEDQKSALNMLSYECRAALHRCYSAAWYLLLGHLKEKYDLDRASLRFHGLMHFDIQLPSNVPGSAFHLFHGHIFALHPGLSLFFQTRTGGELIADYLRTDETDPAFQRLLNGFYVALADYYVRSDECANARKRSSRDEKSADIEEVAAAQTKGRGRRGLAGPKRT